MTTLRQPPYERGAWLPFYPKRGMSEVRVFRENRESWEIGDREKSLLKCQRVSEESTHILPQNKATSFLVDSG